MCAIVEPCRNCGSNELEVKEGSIGYWVACSCGNKGFFRSNIDEAIIAWNTQQHLNFYCELQQSFRQLAGNFTLWFLAYWERDFYRRIEDLKYLRQRCEEWIRS